MIKKMGESQKIQFRKISAKDENLEEVRTRFKKVLDEFSSYRETLSQHMGFKNTGSCGSYVLYLARMVVLYEENFNEVIRNLNDIETYKKLNLLRKSPNFKSYNSQEGRFPNAALNGFRNFLTANFAIEEQQYDAVFNEKLLSIPVGEIEGLIKEPTKKIVKNMQNRTYLYYRNVIESQQAKINANWTCEYDEKHKTFISEGNKKPYVEAHHLIPILAQIDFENTIDFADNIIALCPTCHRNIHYGTREEKEKMLDFFFQNRKSRYSKYGIEITVSDLKGYYL